MEGLWQALANLVAELVPCVSCSLLFDMDGYEPRQGRHLLVSTRHVRQPETSLAIAAPYLAINPQVRWYTYSQIALEDASARARRLAQDPESNWQEFIHLAFWNDARLDVVVSVRVRVDQLQLSDPQLDFLCDMYSILDASFQRVRLLETERARYRALDAVLDHLSLATVVVDDRLRPLHLSADAMRICAQWRSAKEHDAQQLPHAIERGIRQALDEPWCARLRPFAGQRSIVIADQQRGLRASIRVSPVPGATARYLLTFVTEAGGCALQGNTGVARLQVLSPREREVATLVARGLSNDAIATLLTRSRRTIECQLGSIYRKLGINNRTELARVLLR